MRDDDTGEDFGQNTSIVTVWHSTPPAGFIPITLNEARLGHALQLRQGDGSLWNVSAVEGGELMTSQVFILDGEADARTVDITYFSAVAPYDPAQTFAVLDRTSEDSYGYFSAGVSAAELTSGIPREFPSP